MQQRELEANAREQARERECRHLCPCRELIVYHSENKVKPSVLESIINLWVTIGRESVSKAHHSNNEIDFQPGLINNISEEVCSQLHSGIMKATRKALEDYSGNEGPASHSVCIQTYSSNTAESLGGKKPVGSLEDFSEAYINFCRKLFYSCMQVVWNDVLYDPVAEHLPLLSSIM
ncbi:hypothetical protein Tco_1189118 [Tanacetum coccineum]